MRRYHHDLYRWLYGLDGFRFIADIQRDWAGKYRYFLESKKGISREESGPAAEKFVSGFIDFLHSNGLKESPEGTWIFRNIVDGTLRWPEDSEKVVELIRDFNKAKKSGNFRAERDLLKYKRFPELWQVVNDYFGGDDEPEPDMGLPGVRYLGAYKNLKLYEVNDADSMEEIAKRGSGWCVKDASYGERYLEDGPFLLITKNGKNYVLIHEGSGQAKDASDDTITHEIAGGIFPLVKSHISPYLYGDLLVFLDFYPEVIQLEAIRNNPHVIRHIENPSLELQLTALRASPESISQIKNPTERVQLEAVKLDPVAYLWIKEPTERVTEEYLKQSVPEEDISRVLLSYPYLIENVPNPSEKLQRQVVGLSPYYISYINNPTEAVQVEAVRKRPDAIGYIKNPVEAAQLEVVRANPHMIWIIKDPAERVQLEAIRVDPHLILRIKNPTERAQLEAVEADPNLIRYIENPTEKVQLEAVRRDRSAIQYIHNPTDRVLEEAHGANTAMDSDRIQSDTYATRKSMIRWIHGNHTNGQVIFSGFPDTRGHLD